MYLLAKTKYIKFSYFSLTSIIRNIRLYTCSFIYLGLTIIKLLFFHLCYEKDVEIEIFKTR